MPDTDTVAPKKDLTDKQKDALRQGREKRARRRRVIIENSGSDSDEDHDEPVVIQNRRKRRRRVDPVEDTIDPNTSSWVKWLWIGGSMIAARVLLGMMQSHLERDPTPSRPSDTQPLTNQVADAGQSTRHQHLNEQLETSAANQARVAPIQTQPTNAAMDDQAEDPQEFEEELEEEARNPLLAPEVSSFGRPIMRLNTSGFGFAT